MQHCQGWRLYLLVLTVPLQALGTACFFLMTFHPTELRMTCLKASPCRLLAPMFDSYEGVRQSNMFIMVEFGLLSFQLKTINRTVIYSRAQQTCSGREQGTGSP